MESRRRLLKPDSSNATTLPNAFTIQMARAADE
jgi:hypothetical protein